MSRYSLVILSPCTPSLPCYSFPVILDIPSPPLPFPPLPTQAGDKDSFKLQLNNLLCCRSWSSLPDIMDIFEEKNDGRVGLGQLI